MTKRKLCKKYNDSCIRIFELIKLFAQGETSFSDVIKIFANDNGEVSQISNVLLNKYMNTLKIYGIDVKKSRHTYTLHKMPFSITLNEKELYIVELIKNAMSLMPNGKNKQALQDFVSTLEERYDYDTKMLSTMMLPPDNYDLTFYFKKFEHQIEDCERYCQEGKLLELCYIDNEGNRIKMEAQPQELKYYDKIVCLCVYNPTSSFVFDIPIGSIIYIKKAPVSSKPKARKVYTPVIFKVKDGLAKRYKVREWEKAESMADGTLVITNKGEDIQTLFTRLFKYGENCEILSPKYLRKTMSKKIEKTLKNYDL